jgi:hypothetical protein
MTRLIITAANVLYTKHFCVASTGENFEHRREWIDSRILELATIFAIDICAYAFLLISREQSIAHRS